MTLATVSGLALPESTMSVFYCASWFARGRLRTREARIAMDDSLLGTYDGAIANHKVTVGRGAIMRVGITLRRCCLGIDGRNIGRARTLGHDDRGGGETSAACTVSGLDHDEIDPAMAATRSFLPKSECAGCDVFGIRRELVIPI